MTTSTISAKIKNSLTILTKLYGISEADLGRETKISQATLWRLLNGETDPRASTLNAIANYFQISVDQLIGNKPIIKSTNATTSQNIFVYLPIFSLLKPTELIKMLGKASPGNWPDWIDVEPSIKDVCFAVKVVGESMWPDFIEGTLIIVDPKLFPKHRNYVLCQLHKTNEIVFRQYIEERDEKLLKPIHYAYKTIPLRTKDRIIGVIIQAKTTFMG